MAIYYGCAAQPLADVPNVPANIKGTIRGLITNAINQDPLSGVTVTVAQNSAYALSGNNGSYVLNGLERGGYDLTFAKTGYETLTKPFSVTGDLVTDGSLALKKMPHIASVTVSNLSRSTAQINWLTPLGSAQCYIQYGKSGSTLNEFSSYTTASTTHSVALSGLATGTFYYFQIVALDALDNTIYNVTPVRTLTTGDGRPPRMGEIVVKTYSDTAFLEWSCDRPCYPVVYYGTSTLNLVVGSVPLNLADYKTDQRVILPKLTANTTYAYYPYSIDSFGQYSSEIEQQNVTRYFTTAPVVAVTLSRPEGITNKSARLVWDIDSSMDINQSFLEYRVELYLASPTLPGTLSPFSSVTLAEKNLRTYSLQGLSANRTYFTRIVTIDKTGNQAGSNFQSFKTSAGGIYFDPDFNANPFPGPVLDAVVIQGNSDGTNAEGFMIGQNGRLAQLKNHRTGQWLPYPSPTERSLFAMAGVRGNMIAVGNRTIIAWDGAKWFKVSVPDWPDTVVGGVINFTDVLFLHAAHAPATNRFLVGTQLRSFLYDVGSNSLIRRFRFPYVPPATPIDPAVHNLISGIGNYYGGEAAVYIGTRGQIASIPSPLIATTTANVPNGTDYHDTPAKKTAAASNTLSLNDISMVDAYHGWIVGELGKILRINGTPLWDVDKKDDVIDGSIQRVYAISPTRAYAITSGGDLLELDEIISPGWRVIARYGESLSALNFDPLAANGYNLGIITSLAGHIFYRDHF